MSHALPMVTVSVRRFERKDTHPDMLWSVILTTSESQQFGLTVAHYDTPTGAAQAAGQIAQRNGWFVDTASTPHTYTQGDFATEAEAKAHADPWNEHGPFGGRYTYAPEQRGSRWTIRATAKEPDA